MVRTVEVPAWFEWRDAGVVSGLWTVFLGICYQFYWFTLDDAFITLRYSKHLASGAGLVWNKGAPPVEGYTSFSWMVLGAVPHLLGLPAVAFLKVVGVVSTLAAVAALYVYGRHRGISRGILAIGCAQLAVSPAIAVLSVQGMETTTAMLLVLLVSVCAFEIVREFRIWLAVLLQVGLLLAMLTRPDLVVFAILLEGSIAGVLYSRGQLGALGQLFKTGVGVVFIPGVLYMALRYWYFGHLLPNPFYIKSGVSLLGPILIFTFVLMLLGPLLFITLAEALDAEEIRTRLINVAPIAVSLSGFLALYVFIAPIQGYLWRFQTPSFAAFILISLLVLTKTPFKLGHIQRAITPRTLLTVLLISGLVVFPLVTTQDAITETEQRTPGDRVVMGKALHPLHEEGYRMFVSESGALPYFSEWTAVDRLGLNSERIAHSGLSSEFLEDYEPDMVQLLVKGQPNMLQSNSPVVATYLNNSTYRLVAVVHKQNRDKSNVLPDTFHIYFVDATSPGYQEIACTLRSQDLKYADSSIITAQTAVNVTTVNPGHLDCRS